MSVQAVTIASAATPTTAATAIVPTRQASAAIMLPTPTRATSVIPATPSINTPISAHTVTSTSNISNNNYSILDGPVYGSPSVSIAYPYELPSLPMNNSIYSISALQPSHVTSISIPASQVIQSLGLGSVPIQFLYAGTISSGPERSVQSLSLSSIPIASVSSVPSLPSLPFDKRNSSNSSGSSNVLGRNISQNSPSKIGYNANDLDRNHNKISMTKTNLLNSLPVLPSSTLSSMNLVPVFPMNTNSTYSTNTSTYMNPLMPVLSQMQTSGASRQLSIAIPLSTPSYQTIRTTASIASEVPSQNQSLFTQNIFDNLVKMDKRLVCLPSEDIDESPIFVSLLQYNQILKRRELRARISRRFVKVKHRSRQLHAYRRQRGQGGRFLTKKEREVLMAQQNPEEINDDGK